MAIGKICGRTVFPIEVWKCPGNIAVASRICLKMSE